MVQVRITETVRNKQLRHINTAVYSVFVGKRFQFLLIVKTKKKVLVPAGTLSKVTAWHRYHINPKNGILTLTQY